MDLQVVTFDPITGLASYGIRFPPKILTGLDKLVQIVVLAFLRNPGQNVLSPLEGSGLRADIGQYNFNPKDDTEVRTHCVQRARAVQQEILTRQSSAAGKPSERLQSLTVLNFAWEASSNTAFLYVKIVSEAGTSTNVLV